MAQLVHINRQVPAGAELFAAIKQIQDGLGTIQKHDGLRNEGIGAGAVTYQSIIGTNTDVEAQAMSDRLGALLAAWNDAGNAEYAKLRDIINTLVAA